MPDASAPPSLETAATLAAIDSLQGVLAMARALVLSGREVDLAGLDAEAQRLCAAAACLSRADGRAVRVRLIELQAELDRLSVAMARP